MTQAKALFFRLRAGSRGSAQSGTWFEFHLGGLPGLLTEHGVGGLPRGSEG